VPLPTVIHLRAVLRWSAIAGTVGLLAGGAAALFLVALGHATGWFLARTWLVALLPLAGFAIGLLALRAGPRCAGGTARVLAEARAPTAGLPWQLAPLVLIGTVVTHCCGGSAGREGTAVQMGAALADQLGPPLRLHGRERQCLLLAGIAGGFAAVFGTPLSGVVFALEVAAPAALIRHAVGPCLLAALTGDALVRVLGVAHTAYPTLAVPAASLALWLGAAVVGVAGGVAARLFVAAQQAVRAVATRVVAWPPLRLAAGGALVALAVAALGSARHAGLGIPLMLDAFATPLPPSDAALKLALTALTLGCGFPGGEVTPLFVIGACLGSSLAPALALPVDLLAALGLAALFAGAARAPLACTLLAIELFGVDLALPAAIACIIARQVAGRHGVYQGHDQAGRS